MKTKLLILFTFAVVFSTYSQNSFDLKGFGKIPFTKSNLNYSVTIKDFGSFTFTGTIQPLKLVTKVNIEQLKKFPGYKVLKQLELVDLELTLSSEGFNLGAKIDTKKKIKPVCDALQITAPYIMMEAEVTSNSFEMSGSLDFTEKPVIIDLNKKTGTRLILEKFSLGTKVEVGVGADAVLNVKNNVKFRPTVHDPDLSTVLELSFNLLTLELKGAASLTDIWQDPLGLSHYIGTKKEDIAISNTAIELGWIIGSPTPTNIGFTVGEAKLFDIRWGMLMSMNPTDGEVALQANSAKITMEQLENVLKKMGLSLPTNVVPKGNNYYVDNALILFAPNGGSVGEFEIQRGFALCGGINFDNMVKGDLNFLANLQDGFSFEMGMDVKALFKLLEEEIMKVKEPSLQNALNFAIGTLRLNSLRLLLSASIKNKALAGAAKCDLVLFGKNVKINLNGTFNPQEMVQNLVKEIGPMAMKHIENIGKEVVKVASDAANASIGVAKAGYDKLGYYAEHATTWKDHATHGVKNPITGEQSPSCMKKCVPARANKLGNPVLASSNQAVKDFYDKVKPSLELIAFFNREKYNKADWNRLIASIDNNWKNIIKDQHYKGFDKNQSDVEKLGKKYRELVRAKEQEHINYRNQLWNELVSPLNKSFMIKSTWKNTHLNIETGSLLCSESSKGWLSAQWIIEPVPNSNNIRIKNKWKNTYLNIEYGSVKCTEIQPSWLSALWILEQINGTNIRIKNVWKNTYLNIEQGKIDCSEIQNDWLSAMWILELI